MGGSDSTSGSGLESDDSGMINNISIEVMVAAVIFLFLVIVFVFFLYLYAKNYWGSSIRARRRAQLIFAAGDAPVPSRGLDASVLRSLPVTIYNRSDFKDGLECSVCLCELSDGEKARLLPKCNHGFHLQCIDMWFYSHSTCPLCRCAVGSDTAATAGDGEVPQPISAGAGDSEPQPESPVFPTNVLFWGNQDQVNSRSSANSARNLVITLPNRTAGGFPSPISPLPSSRFPLENIKSPSEESRSPGTSKLKSLRRLWSRGKRTSDSSCSSPMGGDIELGFGISNGEGSSNVPKTPCSS
ncbi:RING-H2 finger protein ATL3-like [Dendrobium catenatum]|uniref:RING-type E3 ubiquitin transferase n=1 Tax=Dendrobium catenatum TaxID=906689 RepID=A0A2I0WGI9_9ASPA|nr:RING-H2 finger protein ATL3-like [Dendrobium catenatum]PKU74784.1 RING-H2 finger protein ATL3 [Dendrobium catenatum]